MAAGQGSPHYGRPESNKVSTRQEVKQLLAGAFEYMSEMLNIEDTVEQVKVFVSAHPFVSCFLALSLLTCLIPISIFLVFAVATLCVSLMILLVVEGTIIACAGVFLLFVLGGCLTFSFGLSVSIAFTYKTLTGLVNLLPSSQPGSHLSQLDQFQNPSPKFGTETLRSEGQREE